MKEYKVSIVVPVYNKEQYLPKFIESVINQTYTNLEIILSDDGSKDRSGSICDEYAQKDNRIKVIHKENGGPSSAWKAGFTVSTGEYISFADSDDWIDAEMISEMVKELKGREDEIILSDYVIERPQKEDEYVYQRLTPGEYVGEQIEDIIPGILGNEHRLISLSRCMKLISRRLIEDNKDYCDPSILMGDDSTIMLPVLLSAGRIFLMDHKAYYHYLYVNDSIVHRYDESMYENNIKLVSNYRSTISDKLNDHPELMARLLHAADREYIYLLLLVLKNEARGNPSGYMENIYRICHLKEVKKLVSDVEIEVTEKSNKLLYAVLKHPSKLMIFILRLAMIAYYR